MFKNLLIGTAIALTAIPAWAQAPRAACLHGGAEAFSDRARRQQAIDFVLKVNAAETMAASGLSPQQPRPYRPLNDLNLPALPAGFAIQFHLEDRSYSFSLKDTRDACHFAIFSDQDKLIYQGMPSTEATVRALPLGTK